MCGDLVVCQPPELFFPGKACLSRSHVGLECAHLSHSGPTYSCMPYSQCCPPVCHVVNARGAHIPDGTYVCPPLPPPPPPCPPPWSVVVLGLLVFAQRMGVNLAALGIGVDFLQVVSLFSSFGFQWPAQLTSLFNASSVTSFNEQLFAPECSVGTWSFRSKWVLRAGAS
jgi:hypothetical protein